MTVAEKTRKTMPAFAAVFTDGLCQFHESGDGVTSAPIKILARSTKPVRHKNFPIEVIHDFESMQLRKQKVNIDYNHNRQQILGFSDSRRVDSAGLWLNGNVIFTTCDATDLAYQTYKMSKGGVEFEASIETGSEFDIEEFRESETVFVNGELHNGPVAVIRNWTLKGVAICPFGADPNTASQFNDSDSVTVNVLENKKLTTETLEKPDADTAQVENSSVNDTENKTVDSTESDDAKTETEQPAAETAPAEPVAEKVADVHLSEDVMNDFRSQLTQFTSEFGAEDGVAFFNEGVSYEKALQTSYRKLKGDYKSLQQRLAAAKINADGEAPTQFSESDETPNEKPKSLTDLVSTK